MILHYYVETFLVFQYTQLNGSMTEIQLSSNVVS